MAENLMYWARLAFHLFLGFQLGGVIALTVMGGLGVGDLVVPVILVFVGIFGTLGSLVYIEREKKKGGSK